MCMFCRLLFVLLYFFFWPLCCLSFFDLRILITPFGIFKLFYILDEQTCQEYFTLKIVNILTFDYKITSLHYVRFNVLCSIDNHYRHPSMLHKTSSTLEQGI